MIEFSDELQQKQQELEYIKARAEELEKQILTQRLWEEHGVAIGDLVMFMIEDRIGICLGFVHRAKIYSPTDPLEVSIKYAKLDHVYAPWNEMKMGRDAVNVERFKRIELDMGEEGSLDER